MKVEDFGLTAEDLHYQYKTEKKSQREIALSIGVDQSVVGRWLKENNIKPNYEPRKKRFNEKFFDVIDSEEKAYWLGFIWSDGYVYKHETKNIYKTKLDLSEQDVGHLEKLKKSLESSHTLKLYDYQGNPFTNSRMVRFDTANNYFSEKLRTEYDLVPFRTSAEKIFNKTPENYKRHLIRGILDADGSVIVYKNNRGSTCYRVSFCTLEDVINRIQDYFLAQNLIKSEVKKFKRHEGRDGNVFQIGFTGNKQVISILQYLYKDSLVYLDRKYEKYIKIIEDREAFSCTSS